MLEGCHILVIQWNFVEFSTDLQLHCKINCLLPIAQMLFCLNKFTHLSSSGTLKSTAILSISFVYNIN